MPRWLKPWRHVQNDHPDVPVEYASIAMAPAGLQIVANLAQHDGRLDKGSNTDAPCPHDARPDD